jgi:hypothetical protein
MKALFFFIALFWLLQAVLSRLPRAPIQTATASLASGLRVLPLVWLEVDQPNRQT